MSRPTEVHRQRARDLMQLALGVGISTAQSEELVARRLAEWYPDPFAPPHGCEHVPGQLVDFFV